MNYVVRGARIVGPNKVFNGDILVEEGRIAALGKVRRSVKAKSIDASGLYALPGFIDIHTHGGMGFDATEGVYDAKKNRFDPSAKAFRAALPGLMKRYAKTGVTRALLATLAAPIRRLETSLGHLADYIEGETNGRDGARLEGVFIEGSFIKNPDFAGAQNPDNFLPPRKRIFDLLNRAARGHIRYVNIVPEHGKTAEQLLRYLTRKGVLVGMGHTSCGVEQVIKCEKLGLRVAVHFLNGPTGSSFKPFDGGNVLQAVLLRTNLFAELICDGWHSSPRYVLDIFRRKGEDRIAAVTDAVFAAGLNNVEDFTLGGIAGSVHPSGEYLQVKGKSHTLFGSVLNMAQAFSNLISWLTGDMEGIWTGRHPIPFERALIKTAKVCATTPANLLGLDPIPGTGALKKDHCADLILVDLKGWPGKYNLEVKHTFVEGRKVV